MILICYLEYNINKRIKTILSLAFKVWTYMISQLVNSPIIFCVRKKIINPTIFVS